MITLSFRPGEEYDDAAERWARIAARPRHQALALSRLTRDDVKRWLEAAMRGEESARGDCAPSVPANSVRQPRRRRAVATETRLRTATT